MLWRLIETDPCLSVQVDKVALIRTGLYPTLEYQPTDRFGASTAHVLRADCDMRTHVTDHRFYDGS